MATRSVPSKLQGEGDHDAARRFNESERKFVKAGKVEKAARKAKPDTPQEEAQLQEAERVGLSHVKK